MAKVLFLHGWHSVPGGVKPTFLADHGHEVINPALDDDDFPAAVRTAQTEYDIHQPSVIVGSSRGGAVAMNIDSRNTPLVLLCPAWKNWGTVSKLKPNSVILHSRQDDVIPFADSEELVTQSSLPPETLIKGGDDHRLADPEPLKAMLEACLSAKPMATVPTFGVRQEGESYKDRNAVYAVVLSEAERVAVVQGPSGHYWLPGGGCLPGESTEEAITREVLEELGRGIRLIDQIGEAVQFFHAANENCYYRMQASFFTAELTDELMANAEHELYWLPLQQTNTAFFHDCHGWAVSRAVQQFTQ